MPEKADIETPRLCQECGLPLLGRMDKKFCNDACRTAFHNRKDTPPALPEGAYDYDGAAMKEMHRIFDILIRNRITLYNIAQYETAEIPLRDLQGYNFNFKYLTSEKKYQDGTVYKFCFDYGYAIKPDEKVMIVYRPEEIIC